MADDIARVLEKVRKLLALSAGATGPEADAALAAAKRLMDEYDLDQAKISEHEVNRTFSAKCFERLPRLTELAEALGLILQECFHVNLIWNVDKREIEIFGQPHHIKVAGYAYVILSRQFQQKWLDSGNTKGSREYFTGMAMKVVETLKAQQVDPRGLIALDDARRRAFADHYPDIEPCDTVRLKDRDLLVQGYADGDDIRLHKPVGDAAKRIAGRIA